MAITTTIVNSFKTEVLNAKHNFNGTSPDTFKLLLLKVGASGTYDKNVTNVGTPGSSAPTTANVGTDEASGTGYTTGGFSMTGVSVALFTDTGTVDWTTDPNWTTATISAIGAVLYNSTQGNKVVACFDFGGTITSTAGTFTVTLPAAAAGTATIRIA